MEGYTQEFLIFKSEAISGVPVGASQSQNFHVAALAATQSLVVTGDQAQILVRGLNLVAGAGWQSSRPRDGTSGLSEEVSSLTSQPASASVGSFQTSIALVGSSQGSQRRRLDLSGSHADGDVIVQCRDVLPAAPSARRAGRKRRVCEATSMSTPAAG